MKEFTEKRMNKLKDWLKNRYNLYFVLILIFAFILRSYYFILTMNQPLWWDEACYGALSRNFISNAWDGTTLILGETKIRPLLFPLLWSFLMRFGINEAGTRFLFEFLPSIFSVILVYLIGKKLYNPRIGLVSSFIFSVLWIHLFYTSRLMTDVPSLFFLLFSIYFFIKSTQEEFNYKFFSISLFLLTLSTLTRYTNGMIFVVYFLMLIIHKKLLLKDKKFWIAGIVGVSPILLFFLMNLFVHGNIFPALLGGDYLKSNQVGKEPLPFAWNFLNYIPVYLSTLSIFSEGITLVSLIFSILFLFFLLGVFIVLFETTIGYNFISQNKKLKNHIFLILLFVVIYSFFIFYLKGAEDRYFFPASLSIIIFSSLGIDVFYTKIKQKNKILGVSLIILILLTGAYTQLKFADSLIKDKKESFLQMKQGFEWIDKNTSKESIVAGSGIEPYLIYYSSRQYLTVPNETEKNKLVDADYFVIHAFTPQENYYPSYIEENAGNLEVAKAFFFDKRETQPALVIYKKKI